MPDKPVASPFKSKLTIVPQPGPKDAPVNENPNTVEPPADTTKPASPESPPEPAETVAPSTSNWNPPIAVSEL